MIYQVIKKSKSNYCNNIFKQKYIFHSFIEKYKISLITK